MVSILDETRPFYLVVQALSGYLSFEGVSVFDEVICRSSITSLNLQSLSQAWIERGINHYKLALLPTPLIDKALLVIVKQFSIQKMIKRKQNSITVY